MKNTLLHDIYLPFPEKQLKAHIPPVGKKCESSEKNLVYYKESIIRYEKYMGKKSNLNNRKGKPLKKTRNPCQIEKDERFWIASTLMNVYYSKNRIKELSNLFSIAYGDKPPFSGILNWKECFKGKLHLYFEVDLPSPQCYKNYLRKKENFPKHHFIPYVLDCAYGKNNLEGSTQVDAIILNENNGFAALIEAKVLSDISIDITYDCVRNQIARNIDVMISENDERKNLCPPLKLIKKDRILFLLLTPRMFKNNYPFSRLYSYKMKEYRDKQLGLSALQKDLPHRTEKELINIPNRIGWLTWDDFMHVNKNCCLWKK